MTIFYRCKHCGNILTLVRNSGVIPVCCGEKVTELVPGSVDASLEKHVPSVTIDEKVVSVVVGQMPHPMIAEHYIEWIALETNQGISIKYLEPTDEDASHTFVLAQYETPICAYAYCNLHGLWKKDLNS